MGLHSLSLRLRQFEEEEREEREEEASDFAMRCDERCSYDDEHLHYTEEVVHFRISRALHTGSEVLVLDFVVEEGEEEGDYVYPPHWFEFSCWEDLVEELNEMVDDAPPIRHEESLLNCDYCGSGICEGEIFGAGYLGEIHVSPRMPDNVATQAFVESSPDPFIMCLGCLLLVNDHTIELWEPEDLNQVGECQECTHARCWRWEACSCLCHQEQSE